MIEGTTLDAWGLAPGRTIGEVVDRVLEVVCGLAVVHEARVVHRDVKEANILVHQRTGRAVLVDFGAGYHEGDPTLTKGMFPPGTLPYPPIPAQSDRADRAGLLKEGVPPAFQGSQSPG